MNHHWAVHLPILANVLKAKVLRLNEVKLNRCALPFAAQCIAHHEVDLWTIERGLADNCTGFNPLVIYCRTQRALGLLPYVIATYIVLFLLRIPQRESDPVVLQAIGIEDL